jgi:hypothetical protein
MTNLNKVFLFRMTHIDNIPHILKFGITHSSSANCNKQYIPIGDSTLINSRSEFIMPDGKKLGSYTPFYFWGRMPMLYVIQHGFNGVTPTAPENIVYCVVTLSSVIDHDLEFVFTDGHAVDHFSSFFGKNDINNIENIVDFNAVTNPYWNKDDDLDLKRRKEAEFLIGSDISLEAIAWYVVYNDVAGIKLRQMGISENKIRINNKFYF